ncbi:MAG: hypothetical protein SFV32_10110 [Opitutaceae bacterium]|nr:hypothetical protein [Opitutaceae bacterium]
MQHSLRKILGSALLVLVCTHAHAITKSYTFAGETSWTFDNTGKGQNSFSFTFDTSDLIGVSSFESEVDTDSTGYAYYMVPMSYNFSSGAYFESGKRSFRVSILNEDSDYSSDAVGIGFSDFSTNGIIKTRNSLGLTVVVEPSVLKDVNLRPETLDSVFSNAFYNPLGGGHGWFERYFLKDSKAGIIDQRDTWSNVDSFSSYRVAVPEVSSNLFLSFTALGGIFIGRRLIRGNIADA